METSKSWSGVPSTKSRTVDVVYTITCCVCERRKPDAHKTVLNVNPPFPETFQHEGWRLLDGFSICPDHEIVVDGCVWRER